MPWFHLRDGRGTLAWEVAGYFVISWFLSHARWAAPVAVIERSHNEQNYRRDHDGGHRRVCIGCNGNVQLSMGIPAAAGVC